MNNAEDVEMRKLSDKIRHHKDGHNIWADQVAELEQKIEVLERERSAALIELNQAQMKLEQVLNMLRTFR